FHVTGVQTCALPICESTTGKSAGASPMAEGICGAGLSRPTAVGPNTVARRNSAGRREAGPTGGVVVLPGYVAGAGRNQCGAGFIPADGGGPETPSLAETPPAGV